MQQVKLHPNNNKTGEESNITFMTLSTYKPYIHTNIL